MILSKPSSLASLQQDSTLQMINSMMAKNSSSELPEYVPPVNAYPKDNGVTFEDPVSHGTEFINDPGFRTPPKLQPSKILVRKPQPGQRITEAFRQVVNNSYRVQAALKDYNSKQRPDEQSVIKIVEEGFQSSRMPAPSSCRDMIADKSYLD
jgi:hypothetical protein